MKKVYFRAEVDENKCVGDRLCETVCPSGAIKIDAKKAHVDERRCVACNSCCDICPEEAVCLINCPEPLFFGVDPKDVDPDELLQFCIEAHLHRRQFACLCTGTRVEEVAVAILKGTRPSKLWSSTICI